MSEVCGGGLCICRVCVCVDGSDVFVGEDCRIESDCGVPSTGSIESDCRIDV